MIATGSEEDLSQWKGCAVPSAESLEGAYARLERLSVSNHTDRGLLDALMGPADIDVRFRHMMEYPPSNKDEYMTRMKAKEVSKDPLFYVVIDRATGVVGGYIAIQAIRPEHGVLEIGNVYMGPSIARGCVSTEAVFLLLQYAFNQLGYRRVEWKCNNQNEKSKAAALRFGFQYEGCFRKHLVTKGLNRDSAWYSIVDDDWTQGVESSFLSWLDPSNFTAEGQQIKSLNSFRS